MSDITLIKPSMEYAEQITELRDELLTLNESFAGCNGLRKCQTVEAWLEYLSEIASQETCPKELVPSDTFLYVRKTDGRVVGIIDIRRHINSPVLSTWGGHIGYTVRPSERRNGYAKRMLCDALQLCRKNGYEKILITCNSDNHASEKTIISNGGVYESKVELEDRVVKRFWVTL